MRNFIYLFVLSILISSCTETYVSTRDIDIEDGKYILEGEVFNGSLVRIRTIGHPSEQNRVYDLTKVKNGIPVSKEGYSYDKGNFKELTLNTGLKTYVSDLIEYKMDENFYNEYYSDGKVSSKSEGTIKDGEFEYNGKTEYFDELGNLIEVEYWKDGERVDK